MDMAYECIASGATYPTLYNDEVNVPAVMYGMRVDEKLLNNISHLDAVSLSFRGKVLVLLIHY